MSEILDLLRKHGERLDSEIAEEMRIPLETVRQQLSRLAATGQVVTCNLTRYKDGERVDGWLCRISGFIPAAPRGQGIVTAAGQGGASVARGAAGGKGGVVTASGAAAGTSAGGGPGKAVGRTK